MTATFDWGILDDPTIGPIIKQVIGKVARSRPLQDPEEIAQEARIVCMQNAEQFRTWASEGSLGLVFLNLRHRLLRRLGPEDRYSTNVSLEAFEKDWDEYDDKGVVARQFDNLAMAGFRGGSGGGGE